MHARRRNAARKGPAAAAIALILPLATAEAAGEPQLTLPIVAALSLATSAARTGQPATAAAGGRRGLLARLPRRIHIPDAYAVKVECHPAPYALGIDSDRLVAFDLLSGSRSGVGWSASLAYDEESRGALARTNDLVRFVVEIRF
jgi:hypothetical protein